MAPQVNLFFFSRLAGRRLRTHSRTANNTGHHARLLEQAVCHLSARVKFECAVFRVRALRAMAIPNSWKMIPQLRVAHPVDPISFL